MTKGRGGAVQRGHLRPELGLEFQVWTLLPTQPSEGATRLRLDGKHGRSPGTF